MALAGFRKAPNLPRMDTAPIRELLANLGRHDRFLRSPRVGARSFPQPERTRNCPCSTRPRQNDTAYVSGLFRSLHARLGGSLRSFVVGGSPLDPGLESFFEALGFGVYAGYGLTECSPVISDNGPGCRRRGSVGRPLTGVEVRIHGAGAIRAGRMGSGVGRPERARTDPYGLSSVCRRLAANGLAFGRLALSCF